MRPACFRPGPRQTVTAERLHADDGADHVAVDVDIADAEAAGDAVGGFGDAGVDAEGEPVAGRVDGGEGVVEAVGAVAGDVEDGAEDFLSQGARVGQLDDVRGDEGAFARCFAGVEDAARIRAGADRGEIGPVLDRKSVV